MRKASRSLCFLSERFLSDCCFTRDREESALLKKYKAEPFSVKTHVHLMAVLKNAYLTLGYEDELQAIMALDGKIGPVYARSWEIVNELEDYKAFVGELK